MNSRDQLSAFTIPKLRKTEEFKKFLLRDVAKILFEGVQTKNHMQWRHQKFLKNELLWGKDIVECKIRSRGLCLAHNQDFAIARELKSKVKYANWETCWQSSVTQTYNKRVSGAEPPAAGGYWDLEAKPPEFFVIFLGN